MMDDDPLHQALLNLSDELCLFCLPGNDGVVDPPRTLTSTSSEVMWS